MKIHDNTPEELISPTRQDWPFKDMKIGQTLEIDSSESELHKKARIAAHSYSSTNDKKFTTKTGSNGSLYIQRIK